VFAFADPIFHLHRPTPLSRACCATRFVTIIRVGRKDRTVPLGLAKTRSRAGRCVGNQAALVVKNSVRFNVRRKVYSWNRARRCTICDSVIVRSAADALQKGVRRVERLVRRSSQSEGGSDTHQLHLREMMGFAGSTHPM